MAENRKDVKLTEEQKTEGFTQDQLLEIEEGRKAGLDVTLYAKPEFLAIQMRQIRLGMQEGLDVSKYASLEYDWFQMEEIRLGLEKGIRTELYASPELSYDRMQQIRLGLGAGIDLSPYKKLKAGVLRELRLGILNKVNIVPYIKAGYGTQQLEAIREALEKGLDIDPYLQKAFRGISIQEICKGLEYGLDVSVYAKPEYCWQQMRELRLGLEHMVDTEQYANTYYSWQQMREIRLGLEEGLDISCYQSLMYTAREMNKKRLALKENPVPDRRRKESFEEKETGAHYWIRVSEDEMEAYMEVQGDVREFERAKILKALRKQGVCYGIRYEEIDRVVRGDSFRKPLLIAKGTPPRHGKDGWYEYFFRTHVARTPKQLDNGNIDYRNVEWFETVREGQKLACYHNAEPGENGISVTMRDIPARRGREQSILTGKGFRRLPDGKTYIASMSGIVTLQDFRLEVSRLLVAEDVNLTTGNIEFDGNVLVQGNVGSGARIKADGDIMVEGFVEGADIICGGSAVLRQGMNASGSGSIRAGGDVAGRFFEATDIYAEGNIQADYFLNCTIHTTEKLHVTGKKGLLAGGRVFAEKGIRTFNLGNQAGLFTYVKLGIGERLMQKETEWKNTVRSAKRELSIFENAHRDMQRKYAPDVRNTMELYLKIESAIYTKEKQLEELMREREALEEEKKLTELVSAVIVNQLYDGVLFEIDGIRWSSASLRNVMVKRSDDRIAVFANYQGGS